MSEMQPDIKTQKRMLTERITQYKQTGYSAFMELEACKAQDPGPTKSQKMEHGEQIKAYESQMKNAYSAGKRLQEILDALDDEEEVKADGEADADESTVQDS